VSPVRNQKRRLKSNILRELKKLKPPPFDGEHGKGEDVEAWLLGMRKYFQLHDYSSNLEEKVSIHHLQGKTSYGETK
jgi:hypothetical protein